MMKLSIQYLLMSFIIMNPLGLLAYAQESTQNPYEGNYELVEPPQPTNNPNKIEVVELFWYTCPHCYSLEKNEYFKLWQKNKAEDVEFTQMPAVFTNDRWEALAKAYYTAQALGVLKQIHRPLFDEIHNPPKRNMNNEKALQRLFVKQGIEEKDFIETFNSFSVQMKMRYAQDMTARYGITGVPVIIVNGKYRLTSEKTNGYKNMMKVIDYLIDVERKAMTSQTETPPQTKETEKQPAK